MLYKIYLDNCCLNRPFDDLSNDLVRMESEAVIAIVNKCEIGEWSFFGSDVLLDEISCMTDIVRKQKVMLLYQFASTDIELSDAILSRGREIEKSGIKPYDALHLAGAEAGNADVLLTTDRQFVTAAKRVRSAVKVDNPLLWLTEVLYEQQF